jgi:hypothetical protein
MKPFIRFSERHIAPSRHRRDRITTQPIEFFRNSEQTALTTVCGARN